MDETPLGQAAAGGPAPAGEVFTAFLRQGLTAFGGPFAQAAQFRREFVERRGWLSEAAFAELLALAQFLPGSISSQLGMAIGLRRGGYAGLLAAWLGFTLPAAAVMIALGSLIPNLDAPWSEGLLHGLRLAAAAVVANAVLGMARSLAVGPIRAGMAIGATVGLLVAHGPVPQILAMAAGAVFGLAFLQDAPPPAEPASPAAAPLSQGVSLAALAAFAVALAGLPFLAAYLGDPTLGLASVVFRSGALTFGNDQVILPLLHREVVGRGWLDADTFLAGYGAAQALPGPLFGFAGFVGAAQQVAPAGWASGAVAILAVFAPGLLLTVGVLPSWERLKARPASRGAMAGVQAVVVGVLAATLWNPVLTVAIERPSDWLLAAGAFVFLSVARLPPWLVVVGFAAATGLFHRPPVL
ncbi:MAG: chromate efflux transporter [Phenylobacterium sp.]